MLTPANIELIGNEVAIRWSDGAEIVVAGTGVGSESRQRLVAR